MVWFSLVQDAVMLGCVWYLAGSLLNMLVPWLCPGHACWAGPQGRVMVLIMPALMVTMLTDIIPFHDSWLQRCSPLETLGLRAGSRRMLPCTCCGV
jgi:hypothetical protein